MQKFTLGAHHGTLLTSKHENSIAYDTNLRYVASTKEDCAVLIIVDAVSRKYFTSETSWLWDIDFDLLNTPQVERVILSGRYCNDLALRFSFTGIPREKLLVQPDIAAAAETLKAEGSEQVYVVTCFSDRDKLLDLPGVGRKSANLIMGDVFGKPAIVTDTHCIRLVNRFGLVDGIKEPKKVEMALWKLIPPEGGSDFCHRLVYHGREICTARTKPYCDKCCLKDICEKRGVE